MAWGLGDHKGTPLRILQIEEQICRGGSRAHLGDHKDSPL